LKHAIRSVGARFGSSLSGIEAHGDDVIDLFSVAAATEGRL
jgi:hypothetical protein